MPVAMKTDRQTLLAAVRKGDFGALLSLADLWAEEGDGQQAAAWSKLVGECRWDVENWKRRRMGVRNSVGLWFRDFAYTVNRLEGKPWHLPKYYRWVGSDGLVRRQTWMRAKEVAYVAAWEWCRDMADKLIRHVKATGESR